MTETAIDKTAEFKPSLRAQRRFHSADAEVLDCFVAQPVISTRAPLRSSGAALCADPLAPRNDVGI